METQTETTDIEAEGQDPADPSESPAEEPREAPIVDRPSRKDRKRERVDVEAANRERDELKRRLEETERRDQQRATELAELRGRWEQSQRQSQQGDKQSATREKVSSLRDQAWDVLARSATAKDQESAIKYRKEYERLTDEANGLIEEMRDEARWEKRRGELQSGAQDPGQARDAAIVSARFPWIENDREAQMVADGRLNSLMASGKPYSRELVIEAIAWAGQVLKRGGASTPTAGQRSLYGGVGGGEGPGGADERPRMPQKTRDNEKLAMAAYDHLDPKEAWKQWSRDMTARKNDDDE